MAAAAQLLAAQDRSFGSVGRDTAHHNASANRAVANKVTAANVNCSTITSEVEPFLLFAGTMHTDVDVTGPAPVQGYWAGADVGSGDGQVISVNGNNFLRFSLPVPVKNIIFAISTVNPAGCVALTPSIEVYDAVNDAWGPIVDATVMANSDSTILASDAFLRPLLTGYELPVALPKYTVFRVYIGSAGLAGLDTLSSDHFAVLVYVNGSTI